VRQRREAGVAEVKKIIIIDDEVDFCFFLKHNLEGTREYSVICANDPEKGLKLVQKELPDALLLDISMPRMDGLAVLEVLKKSPRTQHIPVIMVTALEDDASRLKANTHYVEYYVSKPVDYQDLQKKLNAVLKRSMNAAG
jgi:CheY-like chemotaxis protein